MIGIITDSTCDIPDDLIAKYGITIVPHYVIWGNEQFRDKVDLSVVDFYRRLQTDPVYPSSSQAGIPDFKRAYEEVAGRGFSEIITLTVSSAMSGAYRMASEAATLVDVPVSVVDGKGPTMSLGWQVLAAARARDAGMSVSDILAMLENLKQKLVQYVGMESIEYLKKGGRIGNAVKWLGVMLKIRPLVMINHHTGLVEPVTLARTHKALVESLYKHFSDHFSGKTKMHVAVMHGNVLEEAQQLAERLQADFNPVELLINMTGPVLGINTGPGALALCGYSED